MRTIFDEAQVALPPSTAPTLAALRERAPAVDADELVRRYRAAVSQAAFEDPLLTAACWGCGQELRRALVGLACSSCGIVVPVDERPALPRYVFGARVARGGQGTVWKALYEPLEDWRAVKAIPLLDPEREGRIREEARHANALKHPRIPRVHDVLRDEDTVYIAMEWIEGETLDRPERPRLRDAVEWVRLAAEGIGVAHERGLVHRDVKPGNVMRSPDGAIKVVDFGLALPVSESAPGVTGTPPYMAPEVARGEAATPRSDVWSLGATLYRLVTGHAPVEREPDESLEEYLTRRATARATPAGPPELASVLGRALELDPERRYATAGELAADLACCLDGRAVRAHADSLGLPRRWLYVVGRHVDRNPVATIVGALLAVAAVVLVVALGNWLSQTMDLTLSRELDIGRNELVEARHATWRHDRKPEEVERALRRAAKDLDGSVARHPSSARALCLRAQARRALGDLAGAEADLVRARTIEPLVAGALLALVRLERITLGEIVPTPALAEEIRVEAVQGEWSQWLEGDEWSVLESLENPALAGKLDAAREQFLAQARRAPTAEVCLALARLAKTPDERARWRDAGLELAPGDVRLRMLGR